MLVIVKWRFFMNIFLKSVLTTFLLGTIGLTVTGCDQDWFHKKDTTTTDDSTTTSMPVSSPNSDNTMPVSTTSTSDEGSDTGNNN